MAQNMNGYLLGKYGENYEKYVYEDAGGIFEICAKDDEGNTVERQYLGKAGALSKKDATARELNLNWLRYLNKSIEGEAPVSDMDYPLDKNDNFVPFDTLSKYVFDIGGESSYIESQTDFLYAELWKRINQHPREYETIFGRPIGEPHAYLTTIEVVADLPVESSFTHISSVIENVRKLYRESEMKYRKNMIIVSAHPRSGIYLSIYTKTINTVRFQIRFTKKGLRETLDIKTIPSDKNKFCDDIRSIMDAGRRILMPLISTTDEKHSAGQNKGSDDIVTIIICFAKAIPKNCKVASEGLNILWHTKHLHNVGRRYSPLIFNMKQAGLIVMEKKGVYTFSNSAQQLLRLLLNRKVADRSGLFQHET
jgi:hypothetical protein